MSQVTHEFSVVDIHGNKLEMCGDEFSFSMQFHIVKILQNIEIFLSGLNM